MKKTNYNLLKWLIPLPVLFIAIIIFINIYNKQDIADINVNNTAGNSLSQKADKNDQIESSVDTNANQQVKEATLAIDPYRCRGCGKCVMTDPEHFKLSGGTATVISRENLGSAALANAINICRDRAISLK